MTNINWDINKVNNSFDAGRMQIKQLWSKDHYEPTLNKNISWDHLLHCLICLPKCSRVTKRQKKRNEWGKQTLFFWELFWKEDNLQILCLLFLPPCSLKYFGQSCHESSSGRRRKVLNETQLSIPLSVRIKLNIHQPPHQCLLMCYKELNPLEVLCSDCLLIWWVCMLPQQAVGKLLASQCSSVLV